MKYRQMLIASVLAAAVSGALAAGEAPAKLAFNIPAQPLGRALADLGEQAGLSVLVREEDIKARLLVAPAVTGEFSVQAALERLLADSGLTYDFLDSVTIRVRTAQIPPSGSTRDRSRRAQADQVTDASDNQQRVSTLEEVIVTAQKREERQIDTPQSVSVLSADTLAKLGATQFRDFANTVPGLSFSTIGAGGNQITIRGLSTGFDIGSTVGIYVDDIPFGTSGAFAQGAQNSFEPGLFNIQRVEVLRGPQGTLYGASTMGGLIKYVSGAPDTASAWADAQVGASQTSGGGTNYNVAGDVNVPIAADRVALHASGYQSHDGGYIDNAFLDRADVNRSDTYGGRLDLLVTPSESWTLRVNAFLQNIDRDGEATANYGYTGEPISGGLLQNRAVQEPWNQEFRLVAATIAYDLGLATATSITSYQTVETHYSFDVSPVYVPIFAFFGRPLSAIGYNVATGTDKWTQELRLASETGRPLEWLIGAYYTHEKTTNEQNLAGLTLTGQPAPNDLFVFSVPSTYEEYAAFGDLTWHLTSKLDVTGGVRYAHDNQGKTQTGSGLFGMSQPATESDEHVTTYLANARYRFTEHSVGYLRFATGYRPGGPNFVSVDPITNEPNGPPSFEADKLKSFEAGFKAETEDRRFALDVAAYTIDWSNIQISVSGGNGFTGIDNAPGGATVSGAELTVSARPIRDLTMSGAFAYQDASLDQADANLGAAKGERLPNVPRFTAVVNTDYRLPLGSMTPTVGATLRYAGERFASFDASQGFRQYRLPEYTTVDMRLSFVVETIGARAVDVQLYVRNLFDKRGQLGNLYPQFGTLTEGARIAILQPRTIGASVSTRF